MSSSAHHYLILNTSPSASRRGSQGARRTSRSGSARRRDAARLLSPACRACAGGPRSGLAKGEAGGRRLGVARSASATMRAPPSGPTTGAQLVPRSRDSDPGAIVLSSFFASGRMQLFIHEPHGSGLNRPGAVLRKRFSGFNFDLQAAATEAIVLSRSTSPSFPLEDFAHTPLFYRGRSVQRCSTRRCSAFAVAGSYNRRRCRASAAAEGRAASAAMSRGPLAASFRTGACAENLTGAREVPATRWSRYPGRLPTGLYAAGAAALRRIRRGSRGSGARPAATAPFAPRRWAPRLMASSIRSADDRLTHALQSRRSASRRASTTRPLDRSVALSAPRPGRTRAPTRCRALTPAASSATPRSPRTLDGAADGGGAGARRPCDPGRGRLRGPAPGLVA